MTTKAAEMALAAEGKGCLGKAADDEPVFILRAHDRLAPEIVEAWADKVDAAADALPQTVAGREARLNKTSEARRLANDMRQWQLKNGSKVPD